MTDAAGAGHRPPANTFLGRDAELARLGDLLLGAREPLVTITGPGGAGKTRLAEEFAARAGRSFPGGAHFVDLTRARDAADIARSVLVSLGAPPAAAGDGGDEVANLLAAREELLLVLDNFEQVAACAAGTVGAWIGAMRPAAGGRSRFLVTSRWPLGLEGERTLLLEPLPVDVDAGAAAAAVRLFLDRARAADPALSCDDSELAVIREICVELDGLPLAIEIAASRAHLLRPREILDRLRDRFRKLDRRAADEDGVRRTLRGAIEWSYRLLDPFEQDVFLATCVFRGGFRAAAAEAVLERDERIAAESGAGVLDAIESLCRKQLLRTRATPGGARIDRLVSIDAFGREELGSRFTAERRIALERAHTEHFLHAAEEWGSAPGAASQGRLHEETENLLAAIDRALAAGEPGTAARIALAAERAWSARVAPDPHADRLDRVRAGLAGSDPVRAARLAVAAAAARRRAGRFAESLAAAGAAIDLALAAADPVHEAAARLERAETLRLRRDTDAAAAELARARAILETRGESALLAEVLAHEARALAAAGRAEAARATVVRAEAMARATGAAAVLAGALTERGRMHAATGEYAAVLPCLLEAEAIHRELGDRRGLAAVLSARAFELQRRGDLEGALGALREAEAGLRECGDRAGLCGAISQRGLVATRLGRFGEAITAHGESARIAREIGDRAALAREIGNRGVVEFRTGDIDAALASYREAETIAREVGDRHRTAKEVLNRGLALVAKARHEEALACFDEAERAFRELGHARFLASAIGNRAVILARSERAAEAAPALEEALGILGRAGDAGTHEYFAYQSELARVESELGDPMAAKVSAAHALDLARSLGFDAEHPDAEVRAWLEVLHRLAGRPFRVAMREPAPAEGAAAASPASPTETIDLPPPDPAAGLPPTVSALSGAAPAPRSAYGLDALIGSLLGGCRIVSLIDRGGMGAVYLGERLSDGARVAVKTILPGLHPHPSRLQRFLLEARVSGRFRTPHVIAVHEIGQDGEVHYIVMEYVPGGNLAQRASRERFGVIRPADALRWLAEGARALAEAEELGILHRDLKPQNLLFDAADRLKVADFGLAKDLEASFDITSSRSQPGTPLFMSPEQAAFEALDHRTDQFSLGASFYTALTGHPPADGGSPMEVMRRKLGIARLSPAERLPGGLIPPPLNAIIERMTARDPRERFASSLDLLGAIAAAAAEEGTPPR